MPDEQTARDEYDAKLERTRRRSTAMCRASDYRAWRVAHYGTTHGSWNQSDQHLFYAAWDAAHARNEPVLDAYRRSVAALNEEIARLRALLDTVRP